MAEKLAEDLPGQLQEFLALVKAELGFSNFLPYH